MSLRKNSIFPSSVNKKQLEEGDNFTPQFNDQGLIPCITTSARTGEVLMFAYMNDEALKETIETGEAYYYSRSRQKLWHKGESSGFIQRVEEIKTDCDQDAIWLSVSVEGEAGGCCHLGYDSCFFRSIATGQKVDVGRHIKLKGEESKKVFDPKKVYGDKN